MKLSYTCFSSFSLCSIALSILKESWSISGSTFLPSSLINPNFSRRRTRSLFNSVHELFLLLGDSLCASSVSDIFFLIPSIHPKHRDSSTASKYSNVSGLGVIRTITQHDFSVLQFSCSQTLKSSRDFIGIRFSISIDKLHSPFQVWRVIVKRPISPFSEISTFLYHQNTLSTLEITWIPQIPDTKKVNNRSSWMRGPVGAAWSKYSLGGKYRG